MLKGNCNSDDSLEGRMLMERKLQQLRQPSLEDAGGAEPATAMAAWPGGSKWSGNCSSDGSLARRFLVEQKLQRRQQPGKEDAGGTETATNTAALFVG